MSADGASLLNFLDAPVVVGDPEGRVIFVNPAFEECFAFGAQAPGMPFAELFQGGGREAFLMAVAQVCQTGETVRFRLREEGRGRARLHRRGFADRGRRRSRRRDDPAVR